MTTAYDALFELLTEKKNEQSKEFNEAICYVSKEQINSKICELVSQITKKKTQYTTYSHI